MLHTLVLVFAFSCLFASQVGKENARHAFSAFSVSFALPFILLFTSLLTSPITKFSLCGFVSHNAIPMARRHIIDECMLSSLLCLFFHRKTKKRSIASTDEGTLFHEGWDSREEDTVPMTSAVLFSKVFLS
jgi:hypothetical protein